jgi:hypothetical protein
MGLQHGMGVLNFGHEILGHPILGHDYEIYVHKGQSHLLLIFDAPKRYHGLARDFYPRIFHNLWDHRKGVFNMNGGWDYTEQNL